MIKQLSIEELDYVTHLESMLFDKPWSSSQLISHLNSNNLIWGAWEKGELQGYLIVSEVAHEWEIYRIAVANEFRRMGIAHSLLFHFEKQCQSDDLIFLEVNETNSSAQKLYEKEGFSITGRRKAYYSDGKDAILMMKNVENDGIL